MRNGLEISGPNIRLISGVRKRPETWLIGGLRKRQPKGLDSMIVVGYTIPGHGFRCSFRLLLTNLHINSILIVKWLDRDQVEWAAGFVAGDSIASWPLAMFATPPHLQPDATHGLGGRGMGGNGNSGGRCCGVR